MAAFLFINSVGFSPGKGEVADKIIALAAGEIDWNMFCLWVVDNTRAY